MINIDILGWIGNVCYWVGAYYIGQKKIIGIQLNTIGSICYLWVGIFLNLSSPIFCSIVSIIMNFYAIREWKKQT